jgi:2-C-methyl-D-erythritol 4-phosphate cytidylyltransferase/2-C-methyl-D-erythritol 2,4-cyclodiphosphate synthase
VLIADEEPGPVSGEPRAFVEVLGRSLLGICAETLNRCPEVQGFVVVAPARMEPRAAEFVRASAKFLGTVAGVPDAWGSVVAGVEALPPGFERVVVHDVARPLASPDLFSAVLRALDGADAAVPQLPSGDTVKRVDGNVIRETIPREGLVVVQTPQGYRRQALLAATGMQTGNPGGWAGEVTILATAGFRVTMIPGEPANLEVRTADDIRFVERVLVQTAGRGHGR